MRLRNLVLLLLLVCSLAAPLTGQATSAGELRLQTGGTVPLGPRTYIDLSRPVTANGTITNATVRWLTDLACSDEIKLRFFRMGDNGIAGALQLVGTAGPFAAENGLNILTFPGIDVKAGDLIVVTQMKPGCGGVTFSESPHVGDTVYDLNGDYNGTSALPPAIARHHNTLDVVASNGPMHLVGVVPVVGSLQGGFGSFFRTAMSITNPADSCDIKLVYHPAGTPASPGDPSLTVHLDARANKTYDDVIASMGLSGLGSLDVFATAYTPVITTRVYNDAGDKGTSGFTVDLVTPYEGFSIDDFTQIQLGTDFTNYRTNIGVRTLGTATISVHVFNASGAKIAEVPDKTYAANYFEQGSLTSFLGGPTPPPGGQLFVYVRSGGPVILYSATTDNRTNDGSLKMISFR